MLECEFVAGGNAFQLDEVVPRAVGSHERTSMLEIFAHERMNAGLAGLQR